MEQVTLEGSVETIVYTNEENGYTVCRVAGEDELFTAVGYMPYLTEGEVISVCGKWDVHPSFGKQFKVEYYEKKTGQMQLYYLMKMKLMKMER